ncbi:hypothetical protein HU200_028823 [Digitaria exilis]|uniref:RING-type domain-containing protein n=1 Tax=Digitaria exilis TaxID=1010633 RepID=A0A835EQ67_9POAL|nr:hypothetical protein HU200_028823 [Digitaria exilis]CAB3482305.1 unnamed protein product [Digitaria exilis]
MEAAEPPRPSWRGGVKLQMTLSEGQRLCVTALSLTNPAAAAAASQPMVRVWAQVGDQELTIGMVSPEQPAVAVPAPVEIADGEFLLCHDSASSGVRLYCYYLDPSDLGGDGELMIRRRFVQDIEALGMDDEDDEEARDEFESLTDEDLAERYDSDNGDDEEDEAPQEFEPLTEEDLAEIYDSDKGEYDDEDEEYHQPRKLRNGEAAGEETSSKRRKSIPLVAATAAIVVPDGKLLGPARFAAVKNTAGFMRIAAAEDGTSTAASQVGSKVIVVLYRYTRFSRTWSGRRGVEACRRTKLHRLRFAVPAAGDMASSLAWAGASLSPLIYPGLFRRELRDLWSSLASAIVDAAAIAPEVTRLQVVVDVAILRRQDCTAERMGYMHAALEDVMGEAWPEYYYHVAMEELHLTEPVRRREDDDDGGAGGGDEDDGSRPAKRRRVAAAAEEVEEECSLCLEPMESGLAAWPGCGHEFHGECVEKTLARSDACPLCRRKLSDALIAGKAIQSS